MKQLKLVRKTQFAGTPVPLSFPSTENTPLKVANQSLKSTILIIGMSHSKDMSSIMLWKTRNNVPSISLPISIAEPSIMVSAGPGGDATGESAMKKNTTAVATSAGRNTATRTVATKNPFASSGTLASMTTNGISGDGTLRTATKASLESFPMLQILLKTTSEAPSA